MKMDEIFNARVGNVKELSAKYRRVVPIGDFETKTVEQSITIEPEKVLSGVENEMVLAVLQAQLEYNCMAKLYTDKTISLEDFCKSVSDIERSVTAIQEKAVKHGVDVQSLCNMEPAKAPEAPQTKTPQTEVPMATEAMDTPIQTPAAEQPIEVEAEPAESAEPTDVLAAAVELIASFAEPDIQEQDTQETQGIMENTAVVESTADDSPLADDFELMPSNQNIPVEFDAISALDLMSESASDEPVLVDEPAPMDELAPIEAKPHTRKSSKSIPASEIPMDVEDELVEVVPIVPVEEPKKKTSRAKTTKK